MLQQLRQITGNVAGKADTARAIGCHLATAGGLGHMWCGGWCKVREQRAGRPAVQEHTRQRTSTGRGVAGIQRGQQRRRRRPPNELRLSALTAVRHWRIGAARQAPARPWTLTTSACSSAAAAMLLARLEVRSEGPRLCSGKSAARQGCLAVWMKALSWKVSSSAESIAQGPKSPTPSAVQGGPLSGEPRASLAR